MNGAAHDLMRCHLVYSYLSGVLGWIPPGVRHDGLDLAQEGLVGPDIVGSNQPPDFGLGLREHVARLCDVGPGCGGTEEAKFAIDTPQDGTPYALPV